MGAPPGWIGGWVPWRLVLLRSPDAYCILTNFEAFESGVAFTLLLRLRPGVEEFGPRPGRPPMLMGGPDSTDSPLLGVGLADGTKAVLGRPRPRPDEDPAGPLLIPRGGGGGGDEWRSSVWLWPLPPPGPIRLVMSWPKLRLAENSVAVDANELIAAAAQAEKLWDTDRATVTGLVYDVATARPTDPSHPTDPSVKRNR
jgi:hypothetical protein